MISRNTLLCAGALLLHADMAGAWNWSGVLKSKLQSDNRYTTDARIFSEVWGSLEVFDYQTMKGGIDFVTRQSDQQGFEAEIYQLYFQKQWPDYSSTIKAGRFHRADSLGYYSLDGVNYQYQFADQGITLQLYGGVPRRIEDVRSVDGDWVYGLEMGWRHQLAWNSDWITLDDIIMRGGFQQFAEQETTTRLESSATVIGKFPARFIQSYELAMMTAYQTSSETFEDFMINGMLDFSETIRVRASYELFQPKEKITFREKFHSIYARGRQDLLRVNINNQVNEWFEYHVGLKRARRHENEDVGYGMNAGLRWDYIRDLSLAAEIDYLELGVEKSENIYLSADYTVNADLLANLNLALANNKKRLYGNNQSVGFELNSKYRINSELFLNLSGSYIWYSTIDNEYLAAVQLTWYIDNFEAKAQR